MSEPNNNKTQFDPRQFERPAPQLFTYYILTALFTGPAIFLVLPAMWFRYTTLRYQFEESGLRMKVGILFRKEVITAYRRIQDIHVTSNLFQRWLGISSVSIQTASGSAMPEIVLEGVTDAEGVRDWLYSRLRGAKGHSTSLPSHEMGEGGAVSSSHDDPKEVLQLLGEIRDNLAILAGTKSQGPQS